MTILTFYKIDAFFALRFDYIFKNSKTKNKKDLRMPPPHSHLRCSQYMP